MRKKKKVKLKIRGLVTFIITIVLFGYVSFATIYYGISKNKYKNEENLLREKLYSLKDQETDLNNEINKLKDDDYLARYAREKFLYSKDGEYIIKLEENTKVEKAKQSKKSKIKLYYFLPLLFILLGSLFLLRIRKKKLSK